MNSRDFCYWLQGRAELQPDTPPSAEEWTMIRKHLALVFTNVTQDNTTTKSLNQLWERLPPRLDTYC